MESIRQSFKTRLVIIFMAITGVPILIMGYLSYVAQKEALIKTTYRNISQVCSRIAGSVEYRASEAAEITKTLKVNPIFYTGQFNTSLVEHVFNEYNLLFPAYSGQLLINNKGVVIAATNRSLVGKSVIERPWFKISMEGEIFFSNLYRSPLLEENLIVISMPLKDNQGRTTGVLASMLKPENLWQRMDDYNAEQAMLGSGSYAFAINGSNQIIAHPDKKQILQYKNVVINSLNNHKPVNLQEQGRGYFIYKGNRYMVSFSPIKAPPALAGSGWTILSAMPEKEVLEPVNELVAKYLVMGAALFIFVLLLSNNIAKRLVKPLRDLTHAVVKLPEGQYLEVNTTLHDEVGRLTKAFNEMSKNLKKQKALEMELSRSEKLRAVGQLAAGLAHEIRNPLTTVKGLVQLMANKVDDKSKEGEYYNLILQEVAHSNKILTDLLALAKPEDSPVKSQIDINEVINEVLLLMCGNAKLRGIKTLKNSGNLPLVYIARNQLKQVLVNLLNNAMEAMPSGGDLQLTTEYLPDEEAIMIKIMDTGVGIPKEGMEKLGDPFYTTKDDGTGLGLMLCYRIIENFGGIITIDSLLGSGTTVSIKIPLNYADK